MSDRGPHSEPNSAPTAGHRVELASPRTCCAPPTLHHFGGNNLLKPLLLLLLLSSVGSLLASAGCAPADYRLRADRDAYSLVEHGSTDPRWPLDGYTIEPSPESRMYDPYSPDRPPMPPDDPTSHRLMHYVDHKKGYPKWHQNGDTPHVENPEWMAYLSYDEEGRVILDPDEAMRLALLNSREYQDALETLYLSALDVSLEQYAFDVLFFGGNNTGDTQSNFFLLSGPLSGEGSSSSELTNATGIEANRLFACGGELVVGFANSVVWQFAGPDHYNAVNVLDFSLVQPLLRGAGRAVVLESLTQSERDLLANIRQMERFRRGFYTQIVTGRNPGPGPSRGGLGFGGVSSGGPGSAGGFMGLLEEQVRIRNQEANVDALERNAERLDAYYQIGRAQRFQVDQIRQQFYDAVSTLLRQRAAYQSRLDSYKVLLGLPPDLKVLVQSDLLDRFELIDPAMNATEDRISDLLMGLRSEEPVSAETVHEELVAIHRESLQRLEEVLGDRARLAGEMPARRTSLEALLARPTVRQARVDTRPLGVEALAGRVEKIDDDLARSSTFLGVTLVLWEELDRTLADPGQPGLDPQTTKRLATIDVLRQLFNKLSGEPLAFPLDANRADNLVRIEKGIDELVHETKTLTAAALVNELVDRVIAPKEGEAPDDERVHELRQRLETLLEDGGVRLPPGVSEEDLGVQPGPEPGEEGPGPVLVPESDPQTAALAGSVLDFMGAVSEKLIAPPIDARAELAPAELVKALLDGVAAHPSLVTDAAGTPDPAGLVIQLVENTSEYFSSVPLLQARTRLDRVTLARVDVDEETAFETARLNRRDWMNARAALVDSWRQIKIAQNDLKGFLDVTVDGGLTQTSNTGAPLHNTIGDMSVGLQFDAPFTRRSERNAYRTVLIDYQRARRDYYAIEDSIRQSLRDTLRTIELNKLNFEVQRLAVEVAISQVDESQLRLQTPPKPGETSRFGDTLAQDLVRNLTNLLRAQNDFLGIWVDQEVQRVNLDLDMGTMELDSRGIRIDAGPVGTEPPPPPEPAGDGAIDGAIPIEIVPPPPVAFPDPTT